VNVPAGERSLRNVPLELRYTSGGTDLAAEFFRPCLDAATTYDRAVGFFSSTFYVLVGVAVADFARCGGKMRLVCSPRLSPADIRAMEDGYAARAIDNAVVHELDDAMTDPVGAAVASLLATLIARDVLDIQIAFRPRPGIYHDKVGIFTDPAGDQVTFDGSSNESWSAWSEGGNYEGFHVFTSWADPARAEADLSYFSKLWAGELPSLEVQPLPQVARDRLEEMADPDGIDAAEARVRALTAPTSETASATRPRLRDHQRDVLDDWARRNHRGIVEHATGSGKTITALTAVERSVEAGRAPLVVVPSKALLAQWRDEIARYFGNEMQVLLVGGGHDEWRTGARLRNFLRPGASRLVVATLDTAATDDFTRRLDAMPNLLLVVDEVHRVGSPKRRRLLEGLDAEWRLGLSATWEREGDPAGTYAILDYFDGVLDPVYTLADAVAGGHLCRYRYVVHRMELSEDERAQWIEETGKIGRALAVAGGEVTESINQLLIRRARIIKQAAAKPRLAADVLASLFVDGDAWLVYCDNVTQLRTVRAAVEGRGVACMEYHRQVGGSEEASLAEFRRNGGVMLAIRCLDEGVDIPRIDHALILASSSTTREFVQRRGRVLRRADRKYRAEIHDVIVDATGFDDPTAATFARAELARAREFARSAEDSSATRLMLDRLERSLPVIAAPASVGPYAPLEDDDDDE
jgi:superfamily II DNA or RNA helicase